MRSIWLIELVLSTDAEGVGVPPGEWPAVLRRAGGVSGTIRVMSGRVDEGSAAGGGDAVLPTPGPLLAVAPAAARMEAIRPSLALVFAAAGSRACVAAVSSCGGGGGGGGG